MAPNYGLIIKETTMLLDRFDPANHSVDDFTEETAKAVENMDALDKKFVLDIFPGCVEHRKLLDVVIKTFYGQHGESLSRADRNQYAIICYLAIFCLDDLGLQRFGNMVKSLDCKKMHRFMSFFFDVTNLTTWVRGEWSQIYDAQFVEDNWIGPLLRWRPEIDAIIEYLKSRLSGRSVLKKPPVKTTVPEEFSLTKPKPRALPKPELIPLQEKQKPVPGSTYRAPREMEAIEESKQRNRQKAEEIQYEANMKQFQCANPQKSEHTVNVLSQINESFESKLKFNSFRASGVPAAVKGSNWPIKLNNTAILREKALYDRKVEKELLRMEFLVEGGHESSAFLQWQKEMQERDFQEEVALFERRRCEKRMNYQETARRRIVERNHQAVQLHKQEMAEQMQAYARKRLQEEREMRDLVQQVAEGHKNSRAAKVKLQEFKQRVVKEVSAQHQELLREALEEAQAELSRKFEVREIRAVESMGPIRHKFVDLTETAGHDLLEEMSLAELNERTAIRRVSGLQEEQDKRSGILDDKRHKGQLQLDHLHAIDFHRKALVQAATNRKKEKTARRLHQTAVKEEMALAGLARVKKMQEKQEEERQNESGSRVSKHASAHIDASWRYKQKILDQHHWEDLEKCVEHQLQKGGS